MLSHRSVRQSSQKLRCRVLRRPVPLGHLPVQDAAGKVKAVKLDVRVITLRAQKNILGLEVAVDDAHVVAVHDGGDQHPAEISHVSLAEVRLRKIESGDAGAGECIGWRRRGGA